MAMPIWQFAQRRSERRLDAPRNGGNVGGLRQGSKATKPNPTEPSRTKPNQTGQPALRRRSIAASQRAGADEDADCRRGNPAYLQGAGEGSGVTTDAGAAAGTEAAAVLSAWGCVVPGAGCSPVRSGPGTAPSAQMIRAPRELLK